MRLLTLCMILCPGLAMADAVSLSSQVTEVEIYPQGARIVRAVPFTLPPGRHELRLLDVPRGTPLDTLRVSVAGATLGAVTLREDFVPPAPDRETAALAAARDEVTRLEDALRAKQDEARAVRAAGEAAGVKVDFLRALAQGDALSGIDAGMLRQIVRMAGEETLSARRTAIAAEGEARLLDRAAKDIARDLEKAQQALAALVPETEARNLVSVAVSADAEAEGILTVSYYDWRASWAPVYDARLDSVKDSVTLERGAMVAQTTGENWKGVRLTLSTNAPEAAVAPATLHPEKLQIVEPGPVPVLPRKQAVEGDMLGALAEAPMTEAAPVMEALATVSYGGLSVSYSYPRALDLSSSADTVRLALGALRLDAQTRALAVPRRDRTAFLVADFINTSDEVILPSAATQLFRDGVYVGQVHGQAAIAAGGKARLPFGPIEGIRLERVVTRNEGDRGVLTRSNRIDEETEIKVENLTGADWPLRVLDQVPYSEQEDLEISWRAQPQPDEVDVDDKKGILAWDFDLGPKEAASIRLDVTIDWPEGKELR